MRNELKTVIGGKEVLLVASFANLQAIESTFGVNIFKVITKVMERDVNLDEMADILIKASEGNEANTLSKDDVAREMATNGVTGVIGKVAKFLAVAFSGTSGGSGGGKK